MATKKKTGKKKTGKKGNDGAPQILVAKGGLTASQFLKEINMTLDNPLPAKQLRDFQASLEAVVTEQLQSGNPVNLFGLVKIAPRLHTAGKREVDKVFGDKESGKKVKSYKAKTSFKTGQGIFSKKVKDAMPSVQKLQKVVG